MSKPGLWGDRWCTLRCLYRDGQRQTFVLLQQTCRLRKCCFEGWKVRERAVTALNKTRDKGLPSLILSSPFLCALIQKGSKVGNHPSYTGQPVDGSKRSFTEIWNTFYWAILSKLVSPANLGLKHIVFPRSERAYSDEKSGQNASLFLTPKRECGYSTKSTTYLTIVVDFTCKALLQQCWLKSTNPLTKCPNKEKSRWVAGTYAEMGVLVTWEYTVETGVLADEDKRDPATTFMVKMACFFLRIKLCQRFCIWIFLPT